jgi:hypothetical protein
VRFKSLEEKAISDLNWKGIPFEVDTDTLRATNFTSLVPITINFQKSDITFVEAHGSRRAGLNIFGRVTTPAGRVVEVFEDTIEIDASTESESGSKDAASFAKTLILRKGDYQIEVAVQEVGSDRWGRWVGGVKIGDQ